jgi:hypothetical protein
MQPSIKTTQNATKMTTVFTAASPLSASADKMTRTPCVDSHTISGSNFSRLCKFMIFRDEQIIREIIQSTFTPEAAQLFISIVDEEKIYKQYKNDVSVETYASLLQQIIILLHENEKIARNVDGSFMLMKLSGMMQIQTASPNADIDRMVDNEVFHEWIKSQIQTAKTQQITVVGESRGDSHMYFRIFTPI